MYDFMKRHFHVPLDAKVRSKEWLRSPFAFIMTGDSHFRNVVNVIHSEFVHNNLQDLKCFWLARPYRFWESGGHIKLRLETYIVEEGVTICNDLLDFQFDDVSEDKISFFYEF